jgi:glycosyltransferase involved in cell wall biosynthesis
MTNSTVDRKKMLSICIPVLNEAANISFLLQKLNAVANSLPQYDFEFIFSDNHSTDGSWQEILNFSQTDNRIKGLRFSKNFGFQNSILANFNRASGDAVIQIDADLQDPPELLFRFIEQWENGYHVVFGIRIHRPENWLLRFFRKVGYWVINFLGEFDIPKNAGDFRLLDRKVVDALLTQSPLKPYLRGSIAGLGFEQIGIPYGRDERLRGESKFPVRRIFNLGLVGVINHSLIPLRISTFAGGATLLMSIFGGLYYVIQQELNKNLPPGFTTTQVLILAGIGLNAFFLGIIGEYISRIYRIVRGDPGVIVEDEF